MLDGVKKCSEAMLGLQANLEVVANNIANANTAGFKKDEGIVFSAIYNSAMANEGFMPVGGAEKLGEELSYGTMVNFKPGSLKKTDNIANLSIVDSDGKNFFTLQAEDGVLFTRSGDFKFDSDGYLTTKEGIKVMGQNGAIRATSPDFKVTKEGKIVVDGKEVDSLLITSFKDARYLKKAGNNNFQAYEKAGAHVASKYNIAQGYIESANVNVLKEMVEMMNIMRSYEANQKILQTADQNLQKSIDISRIRG
ncbi:MAG: flagellar hook-basal body complex protein [Armatimonadota bacterium]